MKMKERMMRVLEVLVLYLFRVVIWTGVGLTVVMVIYWGIRLYAEPVIWLIDLFR